MNFDFAELIFTHLETLAGVAVQSSGKPGDGSATAAVQSGFALLE